MQTRRRYLALAGTTLTGVSGCLGTLGGEGDGADATDDGPSGDAGTTTGDAGTTTGDAGTTTADDGTADGFDDVALSDVVVREAVTYYRWPRSTEVLAPTDEQFVLASVSPRGDDPAPAFVFEAGGETWRPGIDRPVGTGEPSVAGRRDGPIWVDPEASTGYLAFRVPSPLSVDDARIAAADGSGATALSTDVVTTLGEPAARFRLDELDVPSTIATVTERSVTLTVTNASDVEGRFLAGVRWSTAIADDDETTVIAEPMAAGETASFDIDLRGAAPDHDDEVTLVVDGRVTAERSIDVVEE